MELLFYSRRADARGDVAKHRIVGIYDPDGTNMARSVASFAISEERALLASGAARFPKRQYQALAIPAQ
jgi:hypothetical protein